MFHVFWVLRCAGMGMITSEVEAEVGMMMTGTMADIRIELQVRILPLGRNSILSISERNDFEQHNIRGRIYVGVVLVNHG